MIHFHSAKARLLFILSLLSLVSVGFYVVNSLSEHSFTYWYMVWNLLLAWVPLILVVVLYKYLNNHPWSSLIGVSITVIWLVFLPNSFYIVSDFIHLGDIGKLDVLSDAIMFLLFSLSGLALGLVSLYLIHRQLLKRLGPLSCGTVIALILLICSFAIYLGRDERWNSWDAVLHPTGILFDISDPFFNPASHHDAFTTTLMFFILLSTIYVTIWQFTRILQGTHVKRLAG